MNDDRQGAAAQTDGPETTQPDPPEKRTSGWQMPEPKFQQTSGYLPQGYLEQAGLAAKAPAAPASPVPPITSPDVDVPAESIPNVGPQPDIAEPIEDVPEASAPPAAPARSTGARVAMLLLGLLGMVIFIAVFLALVYYLFINPQNGGSTF